MNKIHPSNDRAFVEYQKKRIAHWNNLRERAFGVSGRDRQTLVAAVYATARQVHFITVRQAA